MKNHTCYLFTSPALRSLSLGFSTVCYVPVRATIFFVPSTRTRVPGSLWFVTDTAQGVRLLPRRIESKDRQGEPLSLHRGGPSVLHCSYYTGCKNSFIKFLHRHQTENPKESFISLSVVRLSNSDQLKKKVLTHLPC